MNGDQSNSRNINVNVGAGKMSQRPPLYTHCILLILHYPVVIIITETLKT